jgi:hypothetical protein
MLRAVCIVAFVMLLSFPHFSLAAQPVDTPDTRSAAADRYFKAVPFDELRIGIVEESAKQMPEEKRAEFTSFMNGEVNWSYIQDEARSSIVRHFTTAEILALAEFMEKPEGKSVMGKMKYYMADLMPVVQAEVKRALSKHQQPSRQ